MTVYAGLNILYLQQQTEVTSSHKTTCQINGWKGLLVGYKC